MEWAAEEAMRCSGCGWPRDISMAKGADFDFEAVATQCHVCETLRGASAAWKGDNLAAIYWSARQR